MRGFSLDGDRAQGSPNRVEDPQNLPLAVEEIGIVKRTVQRSRPHHKPNRRASPDVVEKRRAARAFNEALLGRARSGAKDGRTERRRKRLLKELADGVARGGKRELKPIDVLSRVRELLDLGEPLASIRKACPMPRPVEATPEIIEGLRRIQRVYTFPAAAYRFVGLDADTLRKAGVIDTEKRVTKKVTAPSAAPQRSRSVVRPTRRVA